MITHRARWVSLYKFPVVRIFLPFGYYFNTNWTRENSHVSSSPPTLPLNRERAGESMLRILCHRRRKDRASAFRFYRRPFEPPCVPIYYPIYVFRDAQSPSQGLIVVETSRKTSKLQWWRQRLAPVCANKLSSLDICTDMTWCVA